MRQFLLILAGFFLFAGCAQAEDMTDDMGGSNHPVALAPFEALMGTWTGEGTDPETPTTDVMRFEWIIGGQAVQHTHIVNGGPYGGRTIYFFDQNLNDGSGGIIYHYFTTAGFHTQGDAWWEGDTLHTSEAVVGHPSITEVRSDATLNEDNTWSVQSTYLDEGEWVPGHGFHYRATPDAEIVFPE